jgi:hypothetical protein
VAIGVDVRVNDAHVTSEADLGGDGASVAGSAGIGTSNVSGNVGVQIDGDRVTTGGGGAGQVGSLSGSVHRDDTLALSEDGPDLLGGNQHAEANYDGTHGTAGFEVSTGRDGNSINVTADIDTPAPADVAGDLIDDARAEVEHGAPNVHVDGASVRVEVPYGDGHLAAEVDANDGLAVASDFDTGAATGRVSFGGNTDGDGSVDLRAGADYRDEFIAVDSQRSAEVGATEGGPTLEQSGSDRAQVDLRDLGSVGVDITSEEGATTVGAQVGDLRAETNLDLDQTIEGALDQALDDAADVAREVAGQRPDQPEVRVVSDVDADVARTGDGEGEFSQHTRIGIEVDDTRITIGQGGTATVTDDGTVIAGDTDLRAEHDGSTTSGGVTASVGESDDGHDTSRHIGVFAEHDDDRVEAGVFRDTEGEAGSGPIDDQIGASTGIYATRNDDTVRAGFEDHTNPETVGDAPSVGVFVEDTDGDRTGAGVILTNDLRGDVHSVGTGGVYVDVDGDRHQADARVSFGSEPNVVAAEAVVDAGPVSVGGRVDQSTAGDSLPTARAGIEVEPPPTPTVDADEFGSLDDLLPDDLLSGDGVETDAATDGDPGTEVPDDTTVTVHDEFGDPLSADESSFTDEAADDDSMFGDAADAIGNAAGAALDSVQDLFEDIIDGISD